MKQIPVSKLDRSHPIDQRIVIVQYNVKSFGTGNILPRQLSTNNNSSFNLPLLFSILRPLRFHRFYIFQPKTLIAHSPRILLFTIKKGG